MRSISTENRSSRLRTRCAILFLFGMLSEFVEKTIAAPTQIYLQWTLLFDHNFAVFFPGWRLRVVCRRCFRPAAVNRTWKKRSPDDRFSQYLVANTSNGDCHSVQVLTRLLCLVTLRNDKNLNLKVSLVTRQVVLKASWICHPSFRVVNKANQLLTVRVRTIALYVDN